jgi:class 3 adenylate cyclase
MSFRIGITIGDVVERDGDLLGDGVNIAARLEGLRRSRRHLHFARGA